MFIKFNEMFRANETELPVVMFWLKGRYRRSDALIIIYFFIYHNLWSKAKE